MKLPDWRQVQMITVQAIELAWNRVIDPGGVKLKKKTMHFKMKKSSAKKTKALDGEKKWRSKVFDQKENDRLI